MSASRARIHGSLRAILRGLVVADTFTYTHAPTDISTAASPIQTSGPPTSSPTRAPASIASDCSSAFAAAGFAGCLAEYSSGLNFVAGSAVARRRSRF